MRTILKYALRWNLHVEKFLRTPINAKKYFHDSKSEKQGKEDFRSVKALIL